MEAICHNSCLVQTGPFHLSSLLSIHLSGCPSPIPASLSLKKDAFSRLQMSLPTVYASRRDDILFVVFLSCVPDIFPKGPVGDIDRALPISRG